MFQFPKAERLSNKKKIDRLFNDGHSISENPLRIIWSFNNDNDYVFLETIIIVSKKK